VSRIREAYAAGRTTSELAAELGVAPYTVAACLKGQTYRDLGGPISNGKGAHAARGTRNSRAKLDEPRVLEIRAAAASGETVRSLAARHAVCIRTACKIVSRITWKHVEKVPRDVAGSSGRRCGGSVISGRPAEAVVLV
jgi:hypothetical protein